MSQPSEVTINTSRDPSALPHDPLEPYGPFLEVPTAEAFTDHPQEVGTPLAPNAGYRQLPEGRDWGYLGFADTAAFNNLTPGQRDFVNGLVRVGASLYWTAADFEQVWASRGPHALAVSERAPSTNLLEIPRQALNALADAVLTALTLDGAVIPTNPRPQSPSGPTPAQIIDLTRSTATSITPSGHSQPISQGGATAHPAEVPQLNRNSPTLLGAPTALPAQQPPLIAPVAHDETLGQPRTSVAPPPQRHSLTANHNVAGTQFEPSAPRHQHMIVPPAAPVAPPPRSHSSAANYNVAGTQFEPSAPRHQHTTEPPAATATHTSTTPVGYPRLMGSIPPEEAHPGSGTVQIPLTTHGVQQHSLFPTPPTANTRLTVTVINGGLHISGGPSQSTPQIAARVEVARSGAALFQVDTLPNGVFHFSLAPEHVTLLLVDNQLPPETRRFALRAENRQAWSTFASARGLSAPITDDSVRRILTGVMMGRMENTQVLNPQGPQLSGARLEAVAENIAYELVGRPQLTSDTISAFAGAQTNPGHNRGGRRNHQNNRRSNNAAGGGYNNNTNNNNNNNNGGNGGHAGARRFNNPNQKSRGRGGK